MKRLCFTLFLFGCFFFADGAALDSLKKWAPKIEGTIRSKYEYNASLNAHRFQVRNARFSINGNFSPLTSYKAEIDLSDEGVTKMLDAFVRIKPADWFVFTLGQQKIPFSTDNLRSPHLLYFANRSFVGKQLSSGLRDVGGTLKFINRQLVAFDFQAGIYNGTGLYNQKEWQKAMNYVLRLEVFPSENSNISLNYNSIQPENLRMVLYDVGAYVDFSNWHLEGEYIYKTYAGNAFPATQSFSVFTAYHFWLARSVFTKITPLLRFDAMTDNNKGYIFNNNTPTTLGDDFYRVDDMARKRITGGVTLSLNKPFLNDIRLNYEKYFYANPPDNKDDKLVVELVVRF